MLRPGREVIDLSIKAGITFELMNIRFDDMAELKAAAAASSSGGIGTDAAISKRRATLARNENYTVGFLKTNPLAILLPLYRIP